MTNNPPIRIYVKKIEKMIIFKIKKYYYLDLLTPERMKSLGNTESKVKFFAIKITGGGADAAARQADERDKGVRFKN